MPRHAPHEPALLRATRGLSDPDVYQQYKTLCHDVFVVEQGWPLPTDWVTGRTAPLPGDAQAIHVVLSTPERCIAGGRITTPGAPLRHRALFESHLPRLEQEKAVLCELNGVAAARGARGTGKAGSAAMRVTRRLLREACALGATTVLTSTGVWESAFLLAKLGFSIIDSAYHHDGPLPRLINMGWSLDEGARRYFEQREAALLAGMHRSAYVADTLVPAAQVGAAQRGGATTRTVIPREGAPSLPIKNRK